jgi:hypothetical protein
MGLGMRAPGQPPISQVHISWKGRKGRTSRTARTFGLLGLSADVDTVRHIGIIWRSLCSAPRSAMRCLLSGWPAGVVLLPAGWGVVAAALDVGENYRGAGIGRAQHSGGLWWRAFPASRRRAVLQRADYSGAGCPVPGLAGPSSGDDGQGGRRELAMLPAQPGGGVAGLRPDHQRDAADGAGLLAGFLSRGSLIVTWLGSVLGSGSPERLCGASAGRVAA